MKGIICAVVMTAVALVLGDASFGQGWRDKLREGMDKARDRVHETTERARESADRQREAVREKARESAERLREKTHETADRIRDKVREEAPRLKEEAREKVKETAERTREAAEQYKEETKPYTSEMRERLGEAAERARERMGEGGKPYREMIGRAAEVLKDPEKQRQFAQKVTQVQRGLTLTAIRWVRVVDPESGKLTSLDTMMRKMAADSGIGGSMGEDPLKTAYLMMVDNDYLLNGARLIEGPGGEYITLNEALGATGTARTSRLDKGSLEGARQAYQSMQKASRSGDGAALESASKEFFRHIERAPTSGSGGASDAASAVAERQRQREREMIEKARAEAVRRAELRRASVTEDLRLRSGVLRATVRNDLLELDGQPSSAVRQSKRPDDAKLFADLTRELRGREGFLRNEVASALLAE